MRSPVWYIVVSWIRSGDGVGDWGGEDGGDEIEEEGERAGCGTHCSL